MHALRRLALGFASALTLASALASALAGAARAGDVTYPQLNNQSNVVDTDLLAIWRNTGPLAKLNASLFSQYVVNGLGKSTFLQIGNNLSDLNNVATARSNLGLGSAALATVGTTGTDLCQLNANCTWTGTEAFNGKVTVGASTTASALFNLQPGAAPTSPVRGDIWWVDGAGMYLQGDSAAAQFAFTTSNVTSASQWQTGRTETLSGDVSGSASGINGTGNWSISTTLAAVNGSPGTYGDSAHVAQVTVDAKGRVSSASSVAINYPSQLPSQSGYVGDLSSNGTGAAWSMRARAVFEGYTDGLSQLGGTNAVVSRLAVGCYYIAFGTSFPNANYTFVGTAGTYTTGSDNYFVVENDSYYARTAAGVGFCVLNTNANPTEGNTIVNISVEAN